MYGLKRFYSILLFCCSIAINSSEYIKDFHSDIRLYQDGMLQVQETITLLYDSKKNNHGIIRNLPTYYQHGLLSHRVCYDVISVLQNSNPAMYKINHDFFHDAIIIGDSHTTLRQEIYAYTITYTTNRQLLLGKDYDALYWNVTGNRWTMPIKKASATIHMPTKFDSSLVTMHGYTGSLGSEQENVSFKIIGQSILCETLVPLKIQQGFTIRISFPKGYITSPSTLENIYWFYSDNVIGITVLLWIILLIVSYLLISFANKIQTIIPIFYPPDMPPSVVAYLYQKRFKTNYFAADLVAMAVDGLITISCNKDNKYVLEKQEKSIETNAYYQQLLQKLFKGEKTITLASHNDFDNALRFCKMYNFEETKSLLKMHTFWYLHFVLIGMVILSLLFIPSWKLLLLFVSLLLVIVFILKNSYQVYTIQGQKIKNDIAGFKLYLKTAQEQYINMVSTPPTKTPELFEKYLPYAIALQVEKAWTAQFASIFTTLELEKKGHQSGWYNKRHGHSFSTSFASQFTESIAILTSTYTKSGSSRSCGGGRGGGGGSTW
ncbi:DUF2207 domain-containing protein [Candidatus Dependentiae bacterium]|nr:DUF2207 domain-containing protein [Candidatus Dependentiae bacterium]